MRPIDTLVWHCTATPEGKEYTVAQIDAMHRARGFKMIGYHKLIHLDGKASEGRPESMVGAHVAGHNTGSIGYSYVGGIGKDGKAKDTRTPAQKETMLRLTKEAITKYSLKRVVGHRDLSPDLDGDGEIEPYEWIKMCPCFNAIPEYAALFDTPKPKGGDTLYVVESGDTLWGIARNTGTTLPELLAANPKIIGTIHPGDRLVIPK